MPIINYNLVAIEANKLIEKMVISNSIEDHQLYLSFIEACGWNDKSFDQETLRRIENAWE